VSLSDNFHGIRSYSEHPMNKINQAPQLNWQQSAPISSQSSLQHQTFFSQSQSTVPPVQNIFSDMNQTAPLVVPNLQATAIGSKIVIPNRNPSIAVSEGLTYNQSQLLENLTVKNKKAASIEKVEKAVPSVAKQSSINKQPMMSQNFTEKVQNSGKVSTPQKTPKSTALSNMLQTAESGIKQVPYRNSFIV